MESDTSPHPMVSKKHNKLIWAIPVTLAVIVIFAGLLTVARRCRHLQNSYENSGYRQLLMNDDAEENDYGDKRGETFHAGIVVHFNFISIKFLLLYDIKSSESC